MREDFEFNDFEEEDDSSSDFDMESVYEYDDDEEEEFMTKKILKMILIPMILTILMTSLPFMKKTLKKKTMSLMSYLESSLIHL